MELQAIKDSLEKMKQKYSQDIGMLRKLEEDRTVKQGEVVMLQAERETFELQKVLLQDASVEARKNARDVLQDMATRALQFIIGDNMSLQIQLDEKGNSPIADFLVKSEYGDYTVEADPAEEEGGGVADIVSFSTFLAMLQLAGKSNVAPLFLDEPSKYVSKAHSENVAKFLYEISSYFDRQVFMVTHDDLLAKMGDKSYHFQIHNGKTTAMAL